MKKSARSIGARSEERASIARSVACLRACRGARDARGKGLLQGGERVLGVFAPGSHASAITDTPAASATYQAGASQEPPAGRVSQVSTVGAKPPNTVKAPLYTIEMPVARTAVGKISESAAGATPLKLDTSTQMSACTTRSVAKVGRALSQRKSGSTRTMSASEARARLRRRPIRSESAPKSTQPVTNRTLPMRAEAKACCALKPKVCWT